MNQPTPPDTILSRPAGQRGGSEVPPPGTGRSAFEEIGEGFPGARILLVDDEPFVRQAATMMLETSGLAVDVAADGAAAVEMARRHPYALILMDIHMPRMNGMDAARAIHALPERGEVPIVAMTGDAFSEYQPYYLDAGLDDFIAKPYVGDQLFATILKWLKKGGRRVEAPQACRC